MPVLPPPPAHLTTLVIMGGGGGARTSFPLSVNSYSNTPKTCHICALFPHCSFAKGNDAAAVVDTPRNTNIFANIGKKFAISDLGEDEI
jgi:hypothetical protein